jgi:hypothetical protein
MANIVISGDTSGSVTLSAPAVSGTTVLTLPTTSGTLVVTGGAQTIEFAAGTVSAPSITFTGDTNTGIYSPAADTIAFTEGGVESMRIDSSGNVGIGTSSPLARLHIEGNSSGAVQAFIENANGSTNSSAELVFGTWSGAIPTGTGNPGPSAKISAINGNVLDARTDLAFSTYASGGSAERMRITSSGQTLINTTSGVMGGSGKAPFLRIFSSTSVNVGLETNGTSDFNMIVFNNGNGEVGTINTSGSATSYNTSSDYRLKENIAPMTGALATVQALKPVTYTWKADGSDGQGFIAHELQAVVPDCVTGDKDAVDAEGKPVYQGIDTSFLVATLTAAIQEQQAIITQLQLDVAALKGAK